MTKFLLLTISVYTSLSAQGLTFRQDTSAFVGWKLDSVKWVAHDTVFSAKVKCTHSWVFRGDSVTFGLHSDFIAKAPKMNKPPFRQQDNSYENRSKICRTCLTEIREHLVKSWHYVPPPKTEFEILKDRQKSLMTVKHK